MTRLMGTMIVLSGAVGLMTANLQAKDDTKKGDSMHPRVKMETTLGDIVLELDAEKAPITVLNFIKYAEDKFYDGTIFHRVMSNFMVQGGGFTADLEKKPGLRPGIKNEWKNGLKNVRGSISMARLGRQPDSGTAQFFLNVVDNAALDLPRDGAAYAVFGKVVEGIDIMDKIRDTEVGTHEGYGGGRSKVVPTTPVVIKSMRLVSAFDRTKAEAAVSATGTAEKEAKKAANAGWDEKLKEAQEKATTTDSGLKYFDLKVGDGAMPKATDRVEVHYTGWLMDGTKFDSSVDRGKPSTFGLNGVIKGWTEGLGSMKVGGKRTLIIPPDLAYGAAGRPSIPANSTLVFDVELLGIK